MAYIGPETVGGRPAWKFGRDDGGTALIDDPVTAMGMGAPVFAAQAPPALAVPEPLPDMRMANNEAMGEFALADMGAADKPAVDAATNVAGGNAPKPPAPIVGPVENLKPRGEQGAASAGPGLTEGQKFQQDEAIALAKSRLPPGMAYSPGHAGREATWMPGQRQGLTLTGDPALDRTMIAERKDAMRASRDEQVKAANTAVNSQLDNFAAARDEAIGRVVDQEIEAVRLEELAKLKDDAMKSRIAERDLAVREATDLKIDPNRIWNDANAGQKIALTLGLALGAFGSGVTGGPNQAMQLLKEYRDADTEKQKARLSQKQDAAKASNTRLAEWMQINDPERFRARAETAKIASQKALTEAMLNKQEYASVHAQLPGVIAGLNAQLNDAMRAEENLYAKQIGEQYLPEIQAARGGMRPMTEKEIKDRAENNKTLGGQIDANGGERPKDYVKLYDPLTGKQAGEGPKELAEYNSKTRSSVDQLDRLKSMGAKWSSMSPEQRAVAAQQVTLVGQEIWTGAMGRTDAPASAESSDVKDMITNPLEFMNKVSTSNKMIDNIRDVTTNKWRTKLKAYGQNPANYDFGKNPEAQVE